MCPVDYNYNLQNMLAVMDLFPIKIELFFVLLKLTLTFGNQMNQRINIHLVCKNPCKNTIIFYSTKESKQIWIWSY